MGTPSHERRAPGAAGRRMPGGVQPAIYKRSAAHGMGSRRVSRAVSTQGGLIGALACVSSMLLPGGSPSLSVWGSTGAYDCTDALDRIFDAVQQRFINAGVALFIMLSPKKKRTTTTPTSTSTHTASPTSVRMPVSLSSTSAGVRKLARVNKWSDIRRKYAHSYPGFARDLWVTLGTHPNGLTSPRRASWPPTRFRRAANEWECHNAVVAAYGAANPHYITFQSGYNHRKLTPAPFESLEFPDERANRLAAEAQAAVQAEAEAKAAKTKIKMSPKKKPLKSILRSPPAGWKPTDSPMAVGSQMHAATTTRNNAGASIISPTNVRDASFTPKKSSPQKRICFADENDPVKPLLFYRLVSPRKPRSTRKRRRKVRSTSE